MAVLLRCWEPQSIRDWQERTKPEPTRFADTISAFLIIISTQASSEGFLTDRQDWEKQSGQAQIGYAMGVVDEMTQHIYGEDPETIALKDQLLACIVKLQLDANALPDIIESHYSDLGNWQDPPKNALRIGLMKVCKMGIYK